MLKELILKNIVLVESATIEFKTGFNVLSGESGAGKSAVLNALNLIAGCRCDTSQIRRGAEKGIVEAIFDITNIASLYPVLENAGIDHEVGAELFIRREVTTQGKSRSFINNQLAQLTLLRDVTSHLFDVVGQHANQKLLQIEYHRKALDLFGDLDVQVASFSRLWDEQLHVKKTLDGLISSQSERMRQIETCKAEIEELEEANLKEGEDEELFAEYTELCNADELIQKSAEINQIFTGEKMPVLPLLNRIKVLLEQLATLSPALSETSATFQNAYLELQEVSHTIRNYEGRIEHNPQRADELNCRLELIAKLKRKYGSTTSEIQDYLKAARSRLGLLESADDQIDMFKMKLKELLNQCNEQALSLTNERKKAAKKLEKAITTNLRQLNMPKVEIDVEITAQNRNKLGDDKIEFYITPNLGEHKVPLRDSASGGELSRMMLSLQAILAGKEGIPTLIFDEIDANIGGETATVVGEKLKEIGKKHQILCITHFQQVAKLAEHHLRISKEETQGRTVTKIEALDGKAQKQELVRMLGG